MQLYDWLYVEMHESQEWNRVGWRREKCQNFKKTEQLKFTCQKYKKCQNFKKTEQLAFFADFSPGTTLLTNFLFVYKNTKQSAELVSTRRMSTWQSSRKGRLQKNGKNKPILPRHKYFEKLFFKTPYDSSSMANKNESRQRLGKWFLFLKYCQFFKHFLHMENHLNIHA